MRKDPIAFDRRCAICTCMYYISVAVEMGVRNVLRFCGPRCEAWEKEQERKGGKR